MVDISAILAESPFVYRLQSCKHRVSEENSRMDKDSVMVAAAAVVLTTTAIFKKKREKISRKFWVNPYQQQRMIGGRFHVDVSIRHSRHNKTYIYLLNRVCNHISFLA